jgi:hypothetical protein
MADLERIKDRIRKMLALAENNTEEEEAKTAAAMAAKLMRKHNLEHADILIESTTAENVVEGHYNRHPLAKWTSAPKCPAWAHSLIIAIATVTETYGTLMYRGDANVDGTPALNPGFIGQPDDVDAALELFHYLFTMTFVFGDQFWVENKEMYTYRGITVRKAKQSYRFGFVEAVRERLIAERERDMEEMRRSASGQAGTALIVSKREVIESHIGRSASYSSDTRNHEYDDVAAHHGHRDGSSIALEEPGQLEGK